MELVLFLFTTNTIITIKKQLLKKVLFFKQQFTENVKITVKSINITNRPYCCFNDAININNFDSNLLKIDKKSYKKIYICYIGHISIKKTDDYENIYNVNLLYLIVNRADEHIEEKN